MEIDEYWYHLDKEKCYRHLDLPRIDTCIFPSHVLGKDKKYWEYIDIDLSQSLIDILNQREVISKYTRLHSLPVAKTYTPHSDYQHLNRDIAALNFVWGGGDSRMSWYKLQRGKFPIAQKDLLGNLVKYYSKENLIEVNSAVISACCLVNLGAIHTVDNYSDQHRTCLSVRLQNPDGTYLTWDDAEIKFKDFITSTPVYLEPIF